MKTLKPNLMYTFKINYNYNNHSKKLLQRHNLAFDKYGNFCTNRNSGKSEMIFMEHIMSNKVNFKHLANIKNRPGTFNQSIATNPKNNRF